MALEFGSKVVEIDVTIGRLCDGDDIGNRLAPWQLVGVMLERTDEDHRSLVGRNGVGHVPTVIEIRRDP